MVPIIVETGNFVRGFINTILYKNQGMLIHMSRSTDFKLGPTLQGEDFLFL